MMSIRSRRTVVLAALLTGACGAGDDDQPPAADATPACEPGADGDTPFELHLGRAQGGAFDEIDDGEQVQIVAGTQGLYMVVVELRAELPMDATDTVCLNCSADLASPIGEFLRSVPRTIFYFDPVEGGMFDATIWVVLGDDPTPYDGSDATLGVTCGGHGLGAETVKSVELLAPGDA